MTFPYLDTTNDYTPINDLIAPTASDSTDDPAGISRGFIPTAAGNLKINTARGTTVTIVVPATGVGVFQYIRVRRVWSTGTTATVLLGY